MLAPLSRLLLDLHPALLLLLLLDFLLLILLLTPFVVSRALHGVAGAAAARQLHVRGRGVGPCLLYTSPSPRDATLSRMPSSA